MPTNRTVANATQPVSVIGSLRLNIAKRHSLALLAISKGN